MYVSGKHEDPDLFTAIILARNRKDARSYSTFFGDSPAGYEQKRGLPQALKERREG